MNKEPLGLYIFRFVCGFGLFVFLCLLYWSSVLLEEGSKTIRSNIAQLNNEILSIQGDLKEIKAELKEFSEKDSTIFQKNSLSSEKVTIRSSRPRMDTNLPNLLKEDLFYTKTLSKILGQTFKPEATFQGASVGKPDNLHPFSNWAEVSQWTSFCTANAATSEFGKYETLAPDLAIKMELRTNAHTHKPEYWVHLREGLFWEPLNQSLFSEEMHLAPHFLKKHPVTASDFKFFFDALMNPYNQEMGAIALRTYLADIEEIKVLDDLTFIVRWKTQEVVLHDKSEERTKYVASSLTGSLRPLASFVYKYFSDGKKILEEDNDKDAYRTSSVWAQNFSQHWAKNIIPSCGPWIFDGMTDRQIKFRRNPNFYQPLAALAKMRIIEFKDTLDAIWQDFKTGRLDSYAIPPNQLIELDQFLKTETYANQAENGLAIKQIKYLAQQFAYIGWNQAKPYFKSKKVRQALTLAIDRKRIIREYLNGNGEEITGTFFPNSPSYDRSIKPFPFDLQTARQYLEEEGWYDSDGDGIIDKLIDGKRMPFKFTLTYYVKAQIGKSICEYIATALKEVGIVCAVNGVDIADLTATFDDKNFDAIFLNWTTGSPPEDPRQLWFSTGAKEKGSSNAVGFANAEVDAIIEKLQYEYDSNKRLKLYHRFDKILYDEQPYTFLYTPKANLLYRDYLQNVFIPTERQDLIPGANIAQPDSSIFWIKKRSN
jgi:peptide/nickel transport system substrate-binding protein